MENNQEMELNLADLLYLLLSKLHYIVLLGALGFLVGFGIAKFVLPVKYTSDVSLYVNNAMTLEQQMGNGVANGSDINAAKLLASTYIVILKNDEIYEEVAKRLLEEYHTEDLQKMFTVTYPEKSGEPTISPGQIRSLVNITTVDNTEVIKITCTSLNPQISADICTYITEIAPNVLIRTTKAGSVEPIGHAKVANAPSSPNVSRTAIIGGLLGAILAAGVIIIADLLDTRIKVADDIKKKFPDLPILAEIPDLYETKGGSRYE